MMQSIFPTAHPGARFDGVLAVVHTRAPREASAVPSTQRPMANAFIRSIPEPDPFASRPIDSTRTFATSP
jgi:hypothetical protein